MRLFHNSRLLEYRSPFGAVPAAPSIELMVRVETEPSEHDVHVILRTWVDGEGERRHKMIESGNGRYRCTLDCDRPAIIWYSFIARCDVEGTTQEHEVRCGAPQGHTGGEGVTYDYENVPSFQITVYVPRTTRPTWYERGMVYQIFPDRYRRDAHWHERSEQALAGNRAGTPRRIVEDWNEPPVYERNPPIAPLPAGTSMVGRCAASQKTLGAFRSWVSPPIYLNPIFEAQSNHRYDTANYMKIDPMLGMEEDFKELCQAAREHGISIIWTACSTIRRRFALLQPLRQLPGRWSLAKRRLPPGVMRTALTRMAPMAAGGALATCPTSPNQDSEKVRELLLGENGVIRHWDTRGRLGMASGCSR